MKPLFKNILKIYLKYATKIALFIHKPVIIVVAGSINKPFVKEEIKKVLEEKGERVRANPKNFNTEIGLPLSILYLPSGYNDYKKWLPAIFKAPGAIFQKDFPKYLVLSLGTSDPGDMKYLLSIIKPNITVITDITQRYLEGFSDMNELVGEYEYLAGQTDENGLIILNNDNYRIKDIAKIARAKVKTFGLSEGADYSAAVIGKSNYGQEIKVNANKASALCLIKKFGRHHIMSWLIAQIVKDHVAGQSSKNQ
jgi:UDP-N-acetylmuramoyl-tripeptide--D-alanyl-D-alanine ligase